MGTYSRVWFGTAKGRITAVVRGHHEEVPPVQGLEHLAEAAVDLGQSLVVALNIPAVPVMHIRIDIN